MTSTHTRSALVSVVLCLAPAIALILSPASVEAKKPASAEAKKSKPAPAPARKKATPAQPAKKTANTAVVAPAAASQVWETPPRDGVETPPSPPAAEAKPAAVPAPAAAAPSAPAAVADSAPAAAAPSAPPGETPAAPPPPPAPPEEETMPVLGPPPTQYVEHLGPSSYPGRLRGLYGGSLWLEPSFHGLQWPHMAKTGVGVSGSVWVDSGYEKISSESPNVMGAARYLQQARAVLRVTPTYVSGRFFIQAQAELVANGCQSTGSLACDETAKGTVDTDDLWLRVGHWNIWDLKVGRFEGWEIYHTGMGLDINTLERRGAKLDNAVPPDYYGVNFLHDRQRGPGLGYIALHGYPTSFLRAEVLTELGTDNVSSAGENYLGVRPTAIFDLGWVKVKGGYEYELRTKGGQRSSGGEKTGYKYSQTKDGYGGAVQFVLEPYAELGANIARGSQVYRDDDGNTDDTFNFTWTSVGGFANIRVGSLARLHVLDDLLVGMGFNWTTRYDSHRAGNNDPDYAAHMQAFGAIQYLVARQLYVKAVFAYARGDFQPSGATGDLVFSNEMWSARVRLMYLY